MNTLRQTPLFNSHKNLQALMAPFGSWEMPIQYTSILAEYSQCRNKAALFDICHMGEFFFQGDITGSGLDSIFTISPLKIKPGRCKYGLLLNEKGGIIDDLIIYRLTENSLMIVVNSETADNDFTVIKNQLHGDFKFDNISDRTAKLDLQGPLSRDVLSDYVGSWVKELSYFGFQTFSEWGEQAVISRTGYTGELGYELYFPSVMAEKIWNDLLKDERVGPAGLGARDILRLEMGYCLYGSDISESTIPFEAGLEPFVDMSRDFTGKDAILAQSKAGLTRERIAFKAVNRRSPRHGYQVLKDNQVIGEVTSGGFSPAVSFGIALATCLKGYVQPGDQVVLAQGTVEIPAEAVLLPFISNVSVKF